jgi:hypothetical protein
VVGIQQIQIVVSRIKTPWCFADSYRRFGRIIKERDYLEGLGEYEKIIIKWTLKK